MNTFGKYFRVTSFGESHGAAVGCIIDGCPAKISLSEKDIQRELNRRRPGQNNITSPRKEKDKVEILSGVFKGKTLGTPIMLLIRNKGQKSKDYNPIKDIYRPGHADKVWEEKFGIRDFRGGGRSSGRETAARVAAGAIAKKIIPSTSITAYPIEIGGKICLNKKIGKEIINEIKKVKAEKDSLGGIIEIKIKNCPKSLGSPVFGKLESDLGHALLSIGAVKGIEFGLGFMTAKLKGSQSNKFLDGIYGGISTGTPITIRIAVKPTSSIGKLQQAHNKKGETVPLELKGRHDPVIVPRLIPVAEAMAALVLADHALASR